MVLALRAQLDAWAHDRGGHARRHHRGRRARLLGRRRHPRALRSRQSRPHDEALQFWRDEYPLNALIKNYRKPYVALIDGIVMGGGVGVSVHGSHRVAGDRFSFAMPEVGIGFFPDVGATWFLPRMPGELGAYCALTGERFNSADALAAGIATHRVPSARFPALLEGLAGTVPVDAVLAAFAEPARARGRSAARRAAIDRLFAGDTRRGHSGGARREAASGSADADMGGANRRHHPDQIAAQPQDRAGAGAARQDAAISRRACAPNSA